MSFAYTLFNDGPVGDRQSAVSVGNNNTYTSPNAVVTRAGSNLEPGRASLSAACRLQPAILRLGAYLVGLACVIIIALFLAVATFTIILSKVFLWLLLGIAPLDDSDAAVQRLLALLLRLAQQRRAICRAANAGLCLPRLLSDRHSADFREPCDDDQQRQRRLVGARAVLCWLV